MSDCALDRMSARLACSIAPTDVPRTNQSARPPTPARPRPRTPARPLYLSLSLSRPHSPPRPFAHPLARSPARSTLPARPPERPAIPHTCPMADVPDCARSKRGKLARRMRAGCCSWRKATGLTGDGNALAAAVFARARHAAAGLVLGERMASSCCRFQPSGRLGTGIGDGPPQPLISRCWRNIRGLMAPHDLLLTTGISTPML